MTEPISRSRPPGRVRGTRQAAAIEDTLREADGFRTAQELFDELRRRGDSVGLTTVYRNLNLLVEAGLADVVHREDGESQFRLCGHSAAAGEHHHHIVCRVCGRSVEVAGPEVEAWADRVAAAAGYTQISHTVELFGLCPDHS
ncbi:transcriptional repressor [Jatrophihabitans sp.]|uniref:Fur family transcriptional regulator n=1 Tax=Jatrophihabitans sp. TaxID=1932789 RepID=UPI0030C695F0|nr:metal uptake regulation protein [Jatrophihabitans sp.]